MRNLFGAAAALFGLSLLVGCAADTDGDGVTEESAMSSSEIVNGFDDSRHPAVVMLAAKQKDNSYSGFCTGTLVRPNKVLTAAHCVVGGAPAQDTAVMFGANTQQPIGLVQASKIAAHPGYKAGGDFPNDVAVITLVGNITNVTPMPMLGAPVPARPAIITHIGFGNSFANTRDDAKGFGTKRFTMKPLLALDPTKLITGQGLCYGDSGGPAIMRINGVETVVGIHSYITSSCNDPENLGASQKLDIVADFIKRNVDS